MKSINHERYYPMVFWVDSLGKLSNVPFLLIIKIFSFFESLKAWFIQPAYYHVYSVTDDNLFSDFPVNILVASLMVYAFHGSTIHQLGIYLKRFGLNTRAMCPYVSSTFLICIFINVVFIICRFLDSNNIQNLTTNTFALSNKLESLYALEFLP